MRNVIILGSGPAGFTAAIYTARADLAPLLFEGPEPGGQLAITTDVENYPGFPTGILGPNFMEACRDQARRFGTEISPEAVVSVDLSRRPFTVKTSGGEHQTRTLIVATGATAKKLGLPSEAKYWGYGVSACATCDGFFFRGKQVIMVGGGDSAVEEADFLTRFAAKVYLAHRRDQLRASKIMVQRAKKNPKIEFLWNTVVEEILGTEDSDAGPRKVTRVRLKNVLTGEIAERPIDGVFLAIGHTPNVEIFGGALELDAAGFIKVKAPTTATNIAGVFACGDVMDPLYKQAVTAAGTGCRAALDAERFLTEHP
ncbi:MAG: thioredoxin-disulfide reductase [Candidatus Sumerlaeota bacterium]|nr:thioredoxin-disulfide reductase [Candidatus Sumerlaeota bacterium]